MKKKYGADARSKTKNLAKGKKGRSRREDQESRQIIRSESTKGSVERSKR